MDAHDRIRRRRSRARPRLSLWPAGRAVTPVLLAIAAIAPVACGSSRPAAGTDGIAADAGAGSIPASLLAQARPIGLGARFHPPARGPVLGRCTVMLGPRDGAHVELFAQDRVVLIAAGIGVRPPWAVSAGRVSSARCYGALVTLDPTGLVLVRRGERATIAALFRAWGQPLSSTRAASFTAPPSQRVRVFVDGRRWQGAPAAVPLATHSEIVLEVGPYVPPHLSYTFPPGT